RLLLRSRLPSCIDFPQHTWCWLISLLLPLQVNKVSGEQSCCFSAPRFGQIASTHWGADLLRGSPALTPRSVDAYVAKPGNKLIDVFVRCVDVARRAHGGCHTESLQGRQRRQIACANSNTDAVERHCNVHGLSILDDEREHRYPLACLHR